MYVAPLRKIHDGLIVSVLAENDSCLAHVTLMYTNFDIMALEDLSAKSIEGVKPCDQTCETDKKPFDLKRIVQLSKTLEGKVCTAVDNMAFKSEYDHLNNPKYTESELTLQITMDDLAERVVALNFGSVRFLAALVRARSGSKNIFTDKDELSKIIIEALEKGYH